LIIAEVEIEERSERLDDQAVNNIWSRKEDNPWTMVWQLG
jgi:hypothetical protein